MGHSHGVDSEVARLRTVRAIDRRVAVCHERNEQANARLEAAGIRVIRVPASELGSHRGGPRCMACPVARDPAASPDAGTPPGELAWPDMLGAVTQPHRWPRQPVGRPKQPVGRLTSAD